MSLYEARSRHRRRQLLRRRTRRSTTSWWCLIYEVGRPNRRDRRLRGKTDAFDAENAARCARRHRNGNVKTADGHVEMVRVIKFAEHAAVKPRAATVIGLKHLRHGHA